MARIYWNSGGGGREYSRLVVDREHAGEASLRIREREEGSLSHSVMLSGAQVGDLIEQLAAIRGQALTPAEPPPMIEGDDYRCHP